MVGIPSLVSTILLLLLFAMTFHISMCSKHRVVRCNGKDRWTLSNFKQGVIDPSNQLSSWSSEENCCAWIGVQCDNITGRVTKLDLNGQFLEGEISLSLLELEFLKYLDLSANDFEAVSVPSTRNSDVTKNQSLITPPHSLANFSNLLYLDLSFNLDLHLDNLHWLSPLSSLKYLNLSGINLRNETKWLQSMAMLSSLSELRLGNCQLSSISPFLKYVNFTSLVTLDLSENNFNSELPHWLFNLSSDISYLDLRWNNFKGQVPESLLNLRNLKGFYLYSNQLKGTIPYWLGQHEHLQHLDLSYNLFYDSIPSTLGNLSSLIDLDISSNLLSGNLPNSLGQLFNLKSLRVGNNSLSGVISETMFSKLSNLETLDLSSSTFEFHLDPDWIPPFQLQFIDLSNNIQGPKFPSWLYTQRSLELLDISSSGISSIHGDMFWSLVAGIMDINLSNNSISGDISNVTLNSIFIDLSNNNFTGGLPHISANAFSVDVSHNSFSGPIFPLYCHEVNGENLLFYVDTSYNLLTGAFPDCWENGQGLYYMNLGNNKLAGEFPLDLSNMNSLQFMDLGNNEFFGTIPTKMPQTLQVMILRFNKFAGNIPPQLCNLSSLHVLVLDHNKLSGFIPQCVYNITDMVTDDASKKVYDPLIFNFFTKGRELQYKYNEMLRIIDLSANNLFGEIPPQVFKLIAVQSLNLSHNHLTGTIPKTIGGMKNLESLDLSNNRLSGEIPPIISTLSFLSYLNLSYNNFMGQIPLGTQLQSFNESSYIGNPELCGAPLTKKCTEEENHDKAKQHAENEVDDSERESLYLGMGVGFAVGFWVTCGSLFLNRAWRHTYFRFLNHVANQFYVAVALKFISFRGTGASSS